MNKHVNKEKGVEVVQKLERDLTGLTEPEKTALISGWAFVKKDIVIHSKQIFIHFYRKFPHYLAYFDFTDDPNQNLDENHSLHAHALNVMNAFGTLIEFGLRDPPLFECSMRKIVRNHKVRPVSRDDIRNLIEVFKDYFLSSVLQQTTILEEALESFCIKVCGSFEISTNVPPPPAPQ